MIQRQYGGVGNRLGGGRRMTRVEIGHAKETFTGCASEEEMRGGETIKREEYANKFSYYFRKRGDEGKEGGK